MFHLFHGSVSYHNESVYLDNSLFGIEVTYTGTKADGVYYLYPHLDQNQGTIRYFAFDTIMQKQAFLSLLKIQGIGWKSAYHICMLPQDEVAQAIDQFDVKYFQRLPGIGPKIAKRLVVELKQHFSVEDVTKLQIDDRLYQDIISSLQALGYSVQSVKKLLPQAPMPLEKERLPEIMKWLIDHL